MGSVSTDSWTPDSFKDELNKLEKVDAQFSIKSMRVACANVKKCLFTKKKEPGPHKKKVTIAQASNLDAGTAAE
eukprot:8654990-Heterocapsa_arctica.AAC.1